MSAMHPSAALHSAASDRSGLALNEPLLDVRGLGHSLGGRVVLDGVQLAVRRGEFVALLGPSGAGKTTLIHCITGLLRPARGAVRIAGADLATLRGRQRRRVAVIFQQFNLVRRLSALDNVLAGRLGHVPAWRGWLRQFEQADRRLALACLDRVGLLAQAGQRADTLSGGQQQRVAIARAMAQQAELIVADEPVASLDPAASAGVLELLQTICRDDGVAVVCSLHQLQLAQQFAHRLVGLSAGRLRFDQRTEQVDSATTSALYGAVPAPI